MRVNTTKKGFLAIACISLAGACSLGGPTPQGKPAGKSAEPVELTMYYAGGSYTDDFFNKYYRDPIAVKFPNIKIRAINGGQKGFDLDSMLAQNEPIDILYSGLKGMKQYLIDPGLAYDLTEQIKKTGYDLGAIEPTSIEMIRQMAGGKLYGLPEYSGVNKLIYNKDLFDKFGVPYPKDNMTWDELYDLAKIMARTDGGVQYFGIAIAFDHYTRMNQLSAPYVDPATGKALLETDKWKRLVSNVVRFYDIPGNVVTKENVSFKVQRDLFLKNAVAMMVFGNVVTEDFAPIRFDFATYPSFSDLPGVGPQANPNFFTVPSISKHKDDAFQVLAFLISREHQLMASKEGREPSIKDSSVREAFSQNVPYLQGKNLKAYFPKAFAPPHVKTEFDDIANKYLTQQMDQLALHQTDLNTALRTANEQADKEIAAAKVRNQ